MGRRVTLLGALAASFALTACATYRARPIIVEGSLAAFQARRLDDPGLERDVERALGRRVSAWPPRSWGFRDLTLAADFYHADLAIARAKLAAAKAAVLTAGARPNPILGLSPSYDISAEPGISPWTLGFSLDIPIETAGKRGYRIAQAEHLANAARLEFASAAWQVRSGVRTSLIDWQAAARSEDALEREVTADRQAVKLLEARLAVGQAAVTDVELVRATADKAELQWRESQKQAAQARLALAAAVGVPEAALARIRIDFTALETLPSPTQAAPSVHDALLNRSDVLGALARYEASEAALQLQIARQYPDLQLGPGFSHGYAARDLENALSFGISLTLPVFNRNQGPIAEARAQREEAAAAFNAVQARAVAQVAEAQSAYRDSLMKLKTADRLLGVERDRLHSVQALFDAGQENRLTLVEAQSELASGELARAQAFTEAQLALGALEDAMQRPTGATRTDTPPESQQDPRPAMPP